MKKIQARNNNGNAQAKVNGRRVKRSRSRGTKCPSSEGRGRLSLSPPRARTSGVRSGLTRPRVRRTRRLKAQGTKRPRVTRGKRKRTYRLRRRRVQEKRQLAKIHTGMRRPRLRLQRSRHTRVQRVKRPKLKGNIIPGVLEVGNSRTYRPRRSSMIGGVRRKKLQKNGRGRAKRRGNAKGKKRKKISKKEDREPSYSAWSDSLSSTSIETNSSFNSSSDSGGEKKTLRGSWRKPFHVEFLESSRENDNNVVNSNDKVKVLGVGSCKAKKLEDLKNLVDVRSADGPGCKIYLGYWK